MVVGQRDLTSFYASKQQQQQQQHLSSSSSSSKMTTSTWCPCITARQSITRTSALLCTCDPTAPRCLTVSPSLAGGSGLQTQQHMFRDQQFGSSPVSPLSWSGQQNDVPPSMDTEKTNEDEMSGGTENTMIVDVPNDASNSTYKRNSPEGLQFAARPIKRARNVGFPSAATILSSSAPLPAEQRDELTRLLQQNAHRGALSYGEVVQHFAQKGVWLGSDARTWLLRVLGQN